MTPEGSAADLVRSLDSAPALFSLGAMLGLSAGISPGPLLTLVVGRSLAYGPREGAKVAVAPLLTDAPIVVVALALASRAGSFAGGLGLLSLLGASFLLWLGLRSLRQGPVDPVGTRTGSRSLRDGFLVNLLSPHPYLFWIGVGAPAVLRGLTVGWIAAAGFILSFFGLLVGTKLLIAVAVGRARTYFRGRAYIRTQRILGLFLIGFAALLFRDALRLLGVGF